MTVGTKLHKALSELEAVKSDMANFALDTQDTNAKKMFFDYEQQLGNIINGLKGRVNYVEREEPQYKVRDQAEKQMK